MVKVTRAFIWFWNYMRTSAIISPANWYVILNLFVRHWFSDDFSFSSCQYLRLLSFHYCSLPWILDHPWLFPLHLQGLNHIRVQQCFQSLKSTNYHMHSIKNQQCPLRIFSKNCNQNSDIWELKLKRD